MSIIDDIVNLTGRNPALNTDSQFGQAFQDGLAAVDAAWKKRSGGQAADYSARRGLKDLMATGGHDSYTGMFTRMPSGAPYDPFAGGIDPTMGVGSLADVVARMGGPAAPGSREEQGQQNPFFDFTGSPEQGSAGGGENPVTWGGAGADYPDFETAWNDRANWDNPDIANRVAGTELDLSGADLLRAIDLIATGGIGGKIYDAIKGKDENDLRTGNQYDYLGGDKYESGGWSSDYGGATYNDAGQVTSAAPPPENPHYHDGGPVASGPAARMRELAGPVDNRGFGDIMSNSGAPSGIDVSSMGLQLGRPLHSFASGPAGTTQPTGGDATTRVFDSSLMDATYRAQERHNNFAGGHEYEPGGMAPPLPGGEFPTDHPPGAAMPAYDQQRMENLPFRYSITRPTGYADGGGIFAEGQDGVFADDAFWFDYGQGPDTTVTSDPLVGGSAGSFSAPDEWFQGFGARENAIPQDRSTYADWRRNDLISPKIEPKAYSPAQERQEYTWQWRGYDPGMAGVTDEADAIKSGLNALKGDDFTWRNVAKTMKSQLGEDWTGLDQKDRSRTIKKLLRENYGGAPRRGDITDTAMSGLGAIYTGLNTEDQKDLINDMRSSALHGNWDWQDIRKIMVQNLGDEFTSMPLKKRKSLIRSLRDLEKFQEGGGVESDEEAVIETARSALMGDLPEDMARQAIDDLVQMFGPEAVQQLMQQVQMEMGQGGEQQPMYGGGPIVGPGGGLEDAITAVDEQGQPKYRLSDGEYVMPADFVSAIGDGSTNEGFRRLEDMVSQVRKQKTGTSEQAPPLKGVV